MTDVNMRILLSSGGADSVVGDVRKITSVLGGNSGLGGVLGGLTIGLVGVGLGLAKMAANTKEAFTQLQNTTGSTDAQMQQYESSIRQISDATGVYQDNLAKGMYQVISANFAGADATKILTTATKDAVETGADQTQVTTGLVVSLNAWNQKASQADTISNQMFETLALGRGSMNDLAGALQTGGALAAHYGLTITDTDAMLATLSTGGMKTFGTSMTGITQLLNVMDGKTDLITKRIHKLGLSFDETKFKSMSTVQQIDYLNQVMAKNQGQEVSVFGSKQAVSVLSILGTHSDLLATNIKKLGDTQGLAKQQTDAWTRTQHDFNFELQDAETRARNLGISAGVMLLPALSNLMDFIRNPLLPVVGDFVGGIENVAHWFGSAGPQGDILKNSLLGIGLAIGAVKMADLVGNIIGMTRNSLDFVQNVGPRVVSMLSGGSGIAGASKTMATDVEENSLVAKESVSAIGDAATTVIGILAGIPLAVDYGQKGGNWILNNIFNQATGTHSSTNAAGTGDIAPGYSGGPGSYNPAHSQPSWFQKFATWLATHGQAGFASGGRNIPGGSYLVGEYGPEIMDVPGGSNISTASQTRSALSGRGGRSGHVTNTFNISIVSQATMTSQLVDELEQEIARRFFAQTGGYSGFIY